MTMDTRPNITKEEYLRDMENTRREAAAYKQIAEGFAVLMELPENAGAERARLNCERIKYRQLHVDCQAFLSKLEALAEQFTA